MPCTPPRLIGRRRFRNRNGGGKKTSKKKGRQMPSKQKSTSLALGMPPFKINAHEQSIFILEIFLRAPTTPTTLCAHKMAAMSVAAAPPGTGAVHKPAWYQQSKLQVCLWDTRSIFQLSANSCVHTLLVLALSVVA